MKTKKLLALVLIIACIPLYSISQNLEGKQLNKADDLNSLVESGIGLLFGAKSIEGEINEVKVTKDAVKSTTVTINYTGFEDRYLKASVVDESKATITAIKSKTVKLPKDATETTVKLELTGESGDSKIESIYLKLLVCKKETDATGKVFAYHLQKIWKSQGLSTSEEKTKPDYIQDDLHIAITPVPIESAKQLKDAKPSYLPLPSKIKKVQVNKSIYKANVIRQPMNFEAKTVQNTAVSTNPPTASSSQYRTINNDLRLAEPPKEEEEQKPVFIANPVLFTLQLDEEQIEKGAKGPGKTFISLWDEIYSDVDFDQGETHISNISTDIFPDQNEHSGYYYYYPSSYNLEWNKYESYQLKIRYGSASEEGSGKVRMYSSLSPKIGNLEKRMVEKLVEDYTKRNNLKFEKLVQMPLSKEPELDLAEKLQSVYEIPVDNISLTVTKLFNPIEVAWSTQTKLADDLMVNLKDIDIDAEILLTPQGETPAIEVPVKISLSNKNVLGQIELSKNTWRNKEWKNEMPFPVHLKYIHALFLNKDDKGVTQPFIYSWDLGDKEVPVLASVKFNGNSIPKMVDNNAEKIWIEYMVKDCKPCKDDIINNLTGGTTTSREQKIEITSYVIEDIGAHLVEVTVRSLFADPKGETIIEMPAVKLKEDFEPYMVSPLFVPEGKTAEYEYKIKVVTDDEIFRSQWIYSNELSIDLNKSAIKNALGKYPGE